LNTVQVTRQALRTAAIATRFSTENASDDVRDIDSRRLGMFLKQAFRCLLAWCNNIQSSTSHLDRHQRSRHHQIVGFIDSLLFIELPSIPASTLRDSNKHHRQIICSNFAFSLSEQSQGLLTVHFSANPDSRLHGCFWGLLTSSQSISLLFYIRSRAHN
jgi:hypothetical protein